MSPVRYCLIKVFGKENEEINLIFLRENTIYSLLHSVFDFFNTLKYFSKKYNFKNMQFYRTFENFRMIYFFLFNTLVHKLTISFILSGDSSILLVPYILSPADSSRTWKPISRPNVSLMSDHCHDSLVQTWRCNTHGYVHCSVHHTRNEMSIENIMDLEFIKNVSSFQI